MNRKGFSLVELSIVLVITGIMLYGATNLYAASSQAAKISANNSTLDAIERALRLYYQTYGDLPCPASGTLALNDQYFALGRESPEGTCTYDNLPLTNAAAGVVPTRTLNLPDSYMFDAWGSRITYVVSDYCVNNTTWTDGIAGSGTDCADAANLTVKDNTDTAGGSVFDTDDNRTTRAAYVVISHGKNSAGAWNRNGTRISVSGLTTSIPELQNANKNSVNTDDLNLVFHDDFFNDGAVAANYFDDFARWKTEAQISYEE
jgi:prepilin-type N-terminal cleavage/methylation domain-containing protein